MKRILNEFKNFINRGNVVDMAVGVMIGAAFKAIVDSLVNNIFSPVLGLFFLKDFDQLSISFAGINIGYGAFIMAVVNFFLIAIVLFAIVSLLSFLRSVGKKKEEAEETAPTTKVCPYCKSEIAIDATRCAHCTSEV